MAYVGPGDVDVMLFHRWHPLPSWLCAARVLTFSGFLRVLRRVVLLHAMKGCRWFALARLRAACNVRWGCVTTDWAKRY